MTDYQLYARNRFERGNSNQEEKVETCGKAIIATDRFSVHHLDPVSEGDYRYAVRVTFSTTHDVLIFAEEFGDLVSLGERLKLDLINAPLAVNGQPR